MRSQILAKKEAVNFEHIFGKTDRFPQFGNGDSMLCPERTQNMGFDKIVEGDNGRLLLCRLDQGLKRADFFAQRICTADDPRTECG